MSTVGLGNARLWPCGGSPPLPAPPTLHTSLLLGTRGAKRSVREGAGWPRCGGCAVATARTHARSWRKIHGAAGMGLGTAFTHRRGLASTLTCPFIQECPNYLQKVGRRAHTHTQKNIAAKWWRRLEQLPLGAAHGGDAAIAQRRTSPILHKLRDSSRNPHLAAPLSPSSAGVPPTRAQDRSPFSWHHLHRPHYPRQSPFPRSSCQPGGERHYFGPQRGQLDPSTA